MGIHTFDALDGQEHTDVPEFLQEDDWYDEELQEDDYLDVTKEYPIHHTLSINGIPFAPLGGVHGMTGQPGSGKTMTLAMVAAAVLGDVSHGMEWLLKDEIPLPKVLYIDTEQERANTQRVNMRICAMLGWDWHMKHEQLKIMTLREVTKAVTRWKKVLKGIYENRPNVVILDGLIDVVADFNDNKDCQEIISKCMALASYYNISLWMLIHENPGTEKMVGHAGSFLERKATDVIVSRKKVDGVNGDVTFEIKSKKVRSKDWAGYNFRVSDSVYKFGVPVLVDVEDPVLVLARCLKANETYLSGQLSKRKIKDRLSSKDRDENFTLAVNHGFLVELLDVIQQGGGHPFELNMDAINEYIENAET